MSASVIKKKFLRKYKLSNQPKLLITLDWLTISAEDNFSLIDFPTDSLSFEYGSFVIEKVEGGVTKHFKQTFNIWLEGERVAIATFDARNRAILGNRAHIKFENHLFYDGQIKAVYDLICSEFELRDVKLSRVDVAVDGVYFHEFLNKYLYDKNSSKMGICRVNDLDNIRPVGFSREHIRSRSFDSFTVGQMGSKAQGTQKSSRYIRYYNKTREIHELNHKQYINEYFTNNGLKSSGEDSPANQVYRFEVEMRAKWFAEIEFSAALLFNPGALESLVRTSCDNFFEFVYATEKNVTRCERIELLSGLAQGVFARIKREVKDAIRTTKILCKKVFSDFIKGCWRDAERFGSSPESTGFYYQQSTALDWVRTQINQNGLHDWLEARWPFWLREIKEFSKPRAIVLEEYHVSKFL